MSGCRRAQLASLPPAARTPAGTGRCSAARSRRYSPDHQLQDVSLFIDHLLLENRGRTGHLDQYRVLSTLYQRRAQDVGLVLGYVPLVLIAMNVFYAGLAYPAGMAADRVSQLTPGKNRCERRTCVDRIESPSESTCLPPRIRGDSDSAPHCSPPGQVPRGRRGQASVSPEPTLFRNPCWLAGSGRRSSLPGDLRGLAPRRSNSQVTRSVQESSHAARHRRGVRTFRMRRCPPCGQRR